MSAVEDVRQAIQDFVAPDPQALKSELKSVDERSKLRDGALSTKIGNLDDKSKLRDDGLAAKIDAQGGTSTGESSRSRRRSPEKWKPRNLANGQTRAQV
jgi:hypothetical protein